MEQLARFSALCASAREVAETLGNGFLVSMAAMSIEAAKQEMRSKIQPRQSL